MKRIPRTGLAGRLNLGKWLTFLASAFWHGFYPGYYMGFMTVPLLLDQTKAFADAAWPAVEAAGLAWLFAPARSPRYVLLVAAQWATVTLAWCYTLLPFCLLDAHKGLAAWRAWGYAGHAVPLAFMALTPLLAAAFPPPRGGRAAPAGGRVSTSSESTQGESPRAARKKAA